MEKKEEDKKENIEISRSFDARRLRRKRRINRGGRVKMSAFSKRREQESAKYRYGGAVGRKTPSRHSKLWLLRNQMNRRRRRRLLRR